MSEITISPEQEEFDDLNLEEFHLNLNDVLNYDLLGHSNFEIDVSSDEDFNYITISVPKKGKK